MKTDILILDSGVSIEHEVLNNGNIQFLFGKQHDNDQNGHGTAVTAILHKHTPGAHITVGRMLDSSGECTQESLLEYLKYIYQHIECKVLHLSLGIREDSKELYNLCHLIFERGTIIVAAFDNAGGISYPAAYSFVIGVDGSSRCRKADDFVFVKNSVVNIKAKSGIQRLAWLNNSYVIAQGTSFASAYVSAYILNKWECTRGDYQSILQNFRDIARFTYDFDPMYGNEKKDNLNFIHRAAAFPYNKEIHGIYHFQDMLTFDLVKVYDIKYSGNIGKKIESFDGKHNELICNIEEITNEEIDTLIIGHVAELESIVDYPIKKQILQLCLEKHINVFSYDNSAHDEFEEKFMMAGLNIASAVSTLPLKVPNNFGKLFSPTAPVLGVFGTTSKQGKFTLQMELRSRFLRDKYLVEQIGTEPSAQLFGMESYPFGYATDLGEESVGYDIIAKLNYMIHDIDLRNPDIILVGSQSGTAPMLFDNLGQFTLTQLVFLLGTLPDVVVLCVNYNEDITYVERTINVIQGVADSKVISLAIYPKYYKNGWQFANAHQTLATEEELNQYALILQDKFQIKTFPLNGSEYYEKLYQYCICYLAGG